MLSNCIAISQATTRGTKRKTVESDDRKIKAPKSDQHNQTQKASSSSTGLDEIVSSDLEKKLEEQSKTLWNIKDELKKNVATSELKEMLEANGQDSAGSEYDLRERW